MGWGGVGGVEECGGVWDGVEGCGVVWGGVECLRRLLDFFFACHKITV